MYCISNNWIASYVREKIIIFQKGSWKARRGKENHTWWKVCTWKFVDKIFADLLIILIFSLISRFSLSSSNVGDSSLRFLPASLLSTSTCWNSEIFLSSLSPTPPQIQYVLKIQVSFWSAFNLDFIEASFELLILFLDCNKFSVGPTLFTLSFIRFHTSLNRVDRRLPMFSFHIWTSVSISRDVFRTQSWAMELFTKISNGYQQLTIFTEKLRRRCLVVLNTPLV